MRGLGALMRLRLSRSVTRAQRHALARNVIVMEGYGTKILLVGGVLSSVLYVIGIDVIQDRTFQVRNVAMDALLALISDIKMARSGGADDAALEQSRRHQRRAQFLLDFIEAENSMGFHADQAAVRILALSLDESRRGQAVLPGSKATPGAETKIAPTPQEVSPGTRPGTQER